MISELSRPAAEVAVLAPPKEAEQAERPDGVSRWGSPVWATDDVVAQQRPEQVEPSVSLLASILSAYRSA